jgi:hypothetical protein
VGKKEEYQKSVAAQLDEMKAQTKELMAQATRSDYDEHLTDIRTKLESAKAELAELKEASDESWQDLRARLDKALGDVQNDLSVVTADSQ